ncbi:unnamed protein product [Macrosiphum euphorbiae]|uniref:Uncharacterized protein n=1 Tax=Macrosiphum euphorbiae TaxID=13131 RepID=A0AAV0XP60_9HEMI|nr:unnamed protein product [Macrosiphum euphorbiae]
MNFRCRAFRSFVDGIQMCKTKGSEARSRRSDRTNTGLQPSNSLLPDRSKGSARPVRSGTSATVPIRVRERRRFSDKRPYTFPRCRQSSKRPSQGTLVGSTA